MIADQIDKRRYLAELLREKEKRDTTRSCYEFTKKSFEILHNRQPMQHNWHIQYICGRLQKEILRIKAREPRIKHLIINLPPRSLKSEILVCASAWAWTQDPSIKIIGSSYSKDLSMEHNVMARRIVESEWYRINWGGSVQITSDVNNKSKFDNEADGFRTCTSTGGTITGKGGDIVIVDDPTNPRQALSETKRKEANDFFDHTLRTRLNEPDIGLFIIIMQRLHEMDLTGYVLDKEPEEWSIINIPAEATPDITPKTLANKYVNNTYFPARFSDRYFASMRKGLGSYGYSGQFLQRPSPEEGGMIKKEWFGEFSLRDLEKKAFDEEHELVWDFTIDPAFTSKESNDATAIAAFTYFKNKMYIREVLSIRMELPELLRFIPEFCHRNGYNDRSRIFIEPKGPGLSAAQSLQFESELNVIIDKAPKDDKTARLRAVSPFIESGRALLLKGAPWVDGFLGQVGSFPNARFDDEVDVLIMAINNCHSVEGSILTYGTL